MGAEVGKSGKLGKLGCAGVDTVTALNPLTNKGINCP